MLIKLLKYDLRALYKYWWICAILSITFSAIGGVSYNILRIKLPLWSAEIDGLMYMCISISAFIGILVAIVGVSAFMLATEVFIFIRFYKHFFSDEGYLTFTLPVKRATLLNSKIISAFFLHLSTIAIIIGGVCIFIFLGVPMTNLRVIFNDIGKSIGELVQGIGIPNFIIIALELLAGIIITIIASHLSILLCITFGSIIVKRGKVFAAIGIYYLASTLLSGLMQILSTFSYIFLPGILINMTANEGGIIISMILLPVIILFIAVTVAMYALELYMIDRKLNLA